MCCKENSSILSTSLGWRPCWQCLRLVLRSTALELIDLINMPQCQPDVVQALQQPPPGVVVNLEFGVEPVGGDLTADEVDGDGCSRMFFDEVPEPSMIF